VLPIQLITSGMARAIVSRVLPFVEYVVITEGDSFHMDSGKRAGRLTVTQPSALLVT
jgi:hypothetical protein